MVRMFPGLGNDPLVNEALSRPVLRGCTVDVCVILGSGLSAAAEGVAVRERIPFEELPGLGGCTVAGHAGELLLARCADKRLALFSGRRHYYETGSMATAAFPVRLAAAMGAKTLLQFSAMGGVDPALKVGHWFFVEDHINLMGRNPLAEVSREGGVAFVDLSRAYRADLYAPLSERLAKRDSPVTLKRGVLAAFAGPSYETPAEIRMARALGASAVGMSVVPEAVWAAGLGMDSLAIGLIVNPAAGVTEQMLDHADVVDAAGRFALQAADIRETLLDLI